MIHADTFSYNEIKKIQQACCHVFLHDRALQYTEIIENNKKKLTYPFIEKLSFDDVKRAYRINVLSYHPDRHQEKPPDEIKKFSLHLEKVNHSYEYLCSLFGKTRNIATENSSEHGKIIAVGGAKGGTGKSIFSANMGILLASAGFSTLVIDLDLGGSDLHIYMGEQRVPETTLNDFLNRKVSDMSDVVIRRNNKPGFIAGNSSELGIANIPFMRKMKLIDAIRKMHVDFVILDLGAGSDFNTLDFFLAADYGIVITMLDQPAYLEAYAFIKTALQRKLTRLFSADSPLKAWKNCEIEEIIYEGTLPSDDIHSRTIKDLLNTISKRQPICLPLVADEIISFSPHLVINQCFDTNSALRIANTIQSVARQRLSINVNYLGKITKNPQIERSISYAHHPIVSKEKTGHFTKELMSIINTLGFMGTSIKF